MGTESQPGHHAIIDVRWQPSASIGEFDAVERLMLHMSGEITDLLDQWGVTEANVQCDMHAARRPSTDEGATPPTREQIEAILNEYIEADDQSPMLWGTDRAAAKIAELFDTPAPVVEEFGALVHDAGRGEIRLHVAYDTKSYPKSGTHVRVVVLGATGDGEAS